VFGESAGVYRDAGAVHFQHCVRRQFHHGMAVQKDSFYRGSMFGDMGPLVNDFDGLLTACVEGRRGGVKAQGKYLDFLS
jgi:hypothetical protein